MTGEYLDLLGSIEVGSSRVQPKLIARTFKSRLTGHYVTCLLGPGTGAFLGGLTQECNRSLPKPR